MGVLKIPLCVKLTCAGITDPAGPCTFLPKYVPVSALQDMTFRFEYTELSGNTDSGNLIHVFLPSKREPLLLHLLMVMFSPHLLPPDLQKRKGGMLEL